MLHANPVYTHYIATMFRKQNALARFYSQFLFYREVFRDRTGSKPSDGHSRVNATEAFFFFLLTKGLQQLHVSGSG